MGERYVVVMAGGSGTRFWPASRRAHPKQFLAIGGDRSLLRQTVERVRGLVPWSRVLVVTGQVHARHAQVELPELPEENLLIEPTGRNTAPCIAWATEVVHARDPEAVVAVLPADHYVADAEDFAAHLSAAMDGAAEGRIVLLGLVPTRPETGYGYIRRGEARGEVGGKALHGVAAFVEKPDAETAAGYLADGGYLWNSGMFVFQTGAMRAAIERHLPALAAGVASIVVEGKKLSKVYPELPSVSVDYGVMEKEGEALSVVPSTFPWSDVGSWDAAREVQTADAADNVSIGDAFLVDSSGCFVDARGGRTVAIVDGQDLVVVDTTDAVLVVPRHKTQSVKKLVEALVARGREELL
jgi:mannose-1-phosphate guanylyltransferase